MRRTFILGFLSLFLSGFTALILNIRNRIEAREVLVVEASALLVLSGLELGLLACEVDATATCDGTGSFRGSGRRKGRAVLLLKAGHLLEAEALTHVD